MDSSDDSNKNFLKHVFNFDDDSKSEILNVIQYSLIALIPIIILNKTMSKYVPDVDETKGSLEITSEIIIQVLFIFIGLLIVHRIITYFPTYSGEKYPEFNIIFIILAVLMIIISLQTKLGEKVNILFERIVELWEGKSEKQTQKQKQNKNNTNQTNSGQSQMITNQMPISQPPVYNDSTSINSLPISSTTQSSQSPTFDNMFRQDTTPLVGAATPGMNEQTYEPMAANSVLGGGFGTNW